MFTKTIKTIFYSWILVLCSHLASAEELRFPHGNLSNILKKLQPYDEVVSLGTKCQVAIQIEHNGIRKLAYPFDWLVSPFDSLTSFIINDGTHFLDRDKLDYKGVYPGNPPYHHVEDTHYGFIILHELLGPDAVENYTQVKTKYKRRIERLFNLLQSDKKVLFIRTSITREEAIYLDNVLHTKYPQLEYTLLALNNTEDFKTEWKLPRIRNFYLPIEPANWEGDYARWKEILSHFNVTPPKTQRPPEERW